MLKNLTIYRIGPDWAPDLALAEEKLGQFRFVECGPTQQKSHGFVEPRGLANGPLVESIGGHWIIKLMTEQRVVPGHAIKKRVDELAEQVEQQTGRKPGKKFTKELKEQALLELLPMAFTKQSAALVWVDPEARLLCVDASSQSKADDVASTLARALDGSMPISTLTTNSAPAASMAAWLSDGQPPAGFTIDRECELKSFDEQKSVVRYGRHRLDTEEVRQHILAGKLPTKLAMTWRDRASFVLKDSGQITKVALLDVIVEDQTRASKEVKADAFDADVTIFTGEVSELIADLIDGLCGEFVVGH